MPLLELLGEGQVCLLCGVVSPLKDRDRLLAFLEVVFAIVEPNI